MRGWWTWCSAWRTFQKNQVKQNLKGSTSRKAVCHPFPYSYRYQSLLKNTFPKLRWQWTCFLFLIGKYIFIHGPFSSHVSYWIVYPMVFFILKIADISETSTVDVGFRMFWAPKLQPLQTVTVVMIPMCAYGADESTEMYGDELLSSWWYPAVLGFSKKTTPFWVEEFFGKGHFVGSCGLAVIIHICFWLLSFCRDWNLARVQNIIFTKNNCSKVRRAHSFFSDHPGFPWNDLTASWSRWIFQQFRWNFLKWAKTAYFQGL